MAKKKEYIGLGEHTHAVFLPGTPPNYYSDEFTAELAAVLFPLGYELLNNEAYSQVILVEKAGNRRNKNAEVLLSTSPILGNVVVVARGEYEGFESRYVS